MSDSPETFGRAICRAQSVAEVLELERAHGLASRFAELDPLVGRLLTKALGGERIIEFKQDELYVNRVFILGLAKAERRLVDEWFAVEKQQSRGLWTLPQKASLSVGYASLRWAYSRWGRFGSGLAMEEGGLVKLATTPDAVFYWGILDDLFYSLCLPFVVRGPQAGELTREEQMESWAEVDVLYRSLGFALEEQLSVMRYQGGWHRLSSSQQLDAKLRLMEAMGGQADVNMGARYRIHSILPLITNYYKKIKKDGRVKRKQALTRALERILSAYWGGDWLAFLSYIGEEPHPDEQITTALPKIKPLVSQSQRVEEVAAEQGLPAEVVKLVAASYWQETGGVSPVEQRVSCLERYWHVFDDLHARQATGMRSLWGLVTDNRYVNLSRVDDPAVPSDLYLELLPKDLLLEVAGLWGTTMNPKWPDRMLTEPFPYQAMVETLGPALKFWEGCALTAWYLCEGPYSRTDMNGLAHYHRKDVAALEQAGTPVDQQLFADLIRAEERLGPPEEIREEQSTTHHGMFSVTVSMSRGTRRRGFEILRDVVTRHRRAWAEKHLQAYIKSRWESEITQAGHAYNLLVQDREGRVPTLKQFARAAAPATNHWFGGNVCGLYSALREKCPAAPKRVHLMPGDVIGFVKRLYAVLPSQSFTFPDGADASRYRERYIEEIANLGVKYIQMEEGLGRPPEMKDLGEKFPYYSKAMPGDVEEGWQTFVKAVNDAREFASSNKALGREHFNQSPATESGRHVIAPVESITEQTPATPHVSVTSQFTSQEPGPPGQPPVQPERKKSWWQRLTGKD
jgi:hypothetical protein